MKVQPAPNQGGKGMGDRGRGGRKGVRVFEVNCRGTTSVMQGVMKVGGECDVIAIQ